MKNIYILDLIIKYVEAIKKGGILREKFGDTVIEVHAARYLLNQTLRQLGLSKDKYFISERAKDLWAKITDEPIEKYFYQDKITCTKQGPISVDLYRGNEAKSYATIHLKKNDTFTYRTVFSNEHMIPINMIINALLKEKELNYENVLEIIDKIRVCRMLKEEDKKIKRKVTRSLELEEVIKVDYEGVGIKVLKL